jgi:hypothetical protein
MAARLKVFTWSDSFHAYTVAATSRAKALAAWGLNRDIFKDGMAEEIDAGADWDAALAAPGAVIERPLSVSVDKIRALSPKAAARSKTKAPAQKPTAGPSKAVLKRATMLRSELDALAEAHAAATAKIETRRSALDAEAQRLDAAYERKRAGLKTRLKAAQTKLR